MHIIDGIRYRKPTWGEIEKKLETSHDYGYGTRATILYKDCYEYSSEHKTHVKSGNGYWTYSIFELRSTWHVDAERYFNIRFESSDECKKHLIENFGGKWKWSDTSKKRKENAQ